MSSVVAKIQIKRKKWWQNINETSELRYKRTG